MNKRLAANHKETIARIRAALTELGPAIDAFKSESVQLRLIDGFVLPALLADEVLTQVEASFEFIIADAAKLVEGDVQKDINSLALWLDALKAQTALLAVLTEGTNWKAATMRCDELALRIARRERMVDQAQQDFEVLKTDDATRDRKKLAMDNIQKFLDILRSMNPQI